jgi:hypothetical protein
MQSTHLYSTQICARLRDKAPDLLRIAVVSLFCIGTLLGTTQLAYSASKQAAHTSLSFARHSTRTSLYPETPLRPLVSCSGTNCNAKDPNSTGCSADAYIVPLGGDGGYTYYYQWGGGVGDGYMNLMYSPTCGTNWSYVTNDFPSNNKIEAQVDNLSTNYYYWNSCSNCASRASLMTYAPTAPTEADGWIRDPTNADGLLIEPCLRQASGTCWSNLPH